MIGPRLRTLGLFAVILALFVVVGGLAGEYLYGSALAGLVLALVFAAVINVVTYVFCDRIALWTNGARIVSEAEAPRLAAIVRELAPRFGLVHPRLALIDSPTPNAFATGRDARHAVVAATQGLLTMMNDRELRGVLAHELAHIKDQDVLVITLAATAAGAISYAAQMVIFSTMFGGRGRGSNVNPILLLLAILGAPIGALLVRLAISRARESHADEVGARTIGDPESLARALEKLEAGNARRPMTTASPASAGLYIVNPFSGGGFARLFSTHPPISQRIARLRAMRLDTTYRVAVAPPPLRGRPLQG